MGLFGRAQPDAYRSDRRVRLRYTDLRWALAAGDRLRKLVESYNFSVSEQVSISMGVTEYRSPESVESLMSRADKTLYQAKEKGRNRVETLVA